MNDNEQREELAREIFIADNSNATDAEREWQEAQRYYQDDTYAHRIADHLIAKGYSKTTTEATK